MIAPSWEDVHGGPAPGFGRQGMRGKARRADRDATLIGQTAGGAQRFLFIVRIEAIA